MRTRRMLSDQARRSGPVKISYLPGFGPPPDPLAPKTKLPFDATIVGPTRAYRVRVHPYGMEFLGWLNDR